MNRPTLKHASTGLAGAIAIASGSQAYGATVPAALPTSYIPTSGVSTQSIPWDVDGDGTQDFEFDFNQASTNGNWVSGIYGIGGVGTAAPVAYTGPYVTYANRLTAGATVGSSSAFAQDAQYIVVLGSRYGTKFYGQFVNHTGGAAITGWAGFEFTEADGLHYGAIELSTSRYRTAANPGGITFIAAEYNTTPGAAVTIPGAVPEPATLGALAFGGAGLAAAALRRRRSTAAQIG